MLAADPKSKRPESCFNGRFHGRGIPAVMRVYYYHGYLFFVAWGLFAPDEAFQPTRMQDKIMNHIMRGCSPHAPNRESFYLVPIWAGLDGLAHLGYSGLDLCFWCRPCARRPQSKVYFPTGLYKWIRKTKG